MLPVNIHHVIIIIIQNCQKISKSKCAGLLADYGVCGIADNQVFYPLQYIKRYIFISSDSWHLIPWICWYFLNINIFKLTFFVDISNVNVNIATISIVKIINDPSILLIIIPMLLHTTVGYRYHYHIPDIFTSFTYVKIIKLFVYKMYFAGGDGVLHGL